MLTSQPAAALATTNRANIAVQPIRDLLERITVRPIPSDHLTAAVAAITAAMPLPLSRGTSFDPGRALETFSVSTATQTVRDMTTGGDRLERITLTVYGTATFRDRTDSGAYVTVRHHLTGQRYTDAWCHANAWNGRALVDLPDGARKSIAAAIFGAFANYSPDDWSALAAESVERDAAHTQRSHIAAAIAVLEAAARS